MIIIKDTTDFKLEGDYAVIIGKFDGVHLGHQDLIERILSKKSEGLKSAVFTFDISPLSFFSGSSKRFISTREEKRRIFESLGIDVLVEYPLNENTSKISGEDFIKEILVGRMNMKYAAVGCDVSYGYKGAGNSELLLKLAPLYGYKAEIIEKIVINDITVSSTVIRDFLEQGKMKDAADFIGVPYAVSGEVLHGNELGRTIGFRTANLAMPERKIIPPYGVYLSQVTVKNNRYKGITNIGVKPTVTDDNKVYVETYIDGFDDDIYGEFINVKLLDFIRKEKKFTSLEELKKQISKDLLYLKN